MNYETKNYIRQRLILQTQINELNKIANGKEQVQRKTLKKRQQKVSNAFNLLGLPEFKYLTESKTEYTQNKNLQKAAKTLSKQLNTYVNKKNQPLRFNDSQKAARGVKVSKFELEELEKLQNDYNQRINYEYKQFIKDNPNLSKETKDFLRGKRAYDPNDSTEIYLPISFATVDFVNEIQKDTNINYFIEETTKEMHRFKDEVGHFNNEKFTEQLDNWVESNDMNTDQKEIITSKFNQLDLLQKFNFNATLETRVSWVESIVSNPRSSLNYFEALNLIINRQKKIDFQTVSYEV